MLQLIDPSRLRKNSFFAQYTAISSHGVSVSESAAGCEKRPSSKAAASEVANRTLAVR